MQLLEKGADGCMIFKEIHTLKQNEQRVSRSEAKTPCLTISEIGNT